MNENNSPVLEQEVPATPAPASDNKSKKEDGFTPAQRKKLRFWRVLAAVELAVVLLLVGARWVVDGWWITWDTGTNKPAHTDSDKNGDFVPPEFDAAAQDGVPTVSSDLGWSALTVQDGYNIHVCGVLRTDSSRSLPVWFANDPGNTVWVKLRITDSDGTVLGETGLLKPGQYVERVQLNDKAASGEVTLQVMGYQPDTYYSAGSVGLATTLTIS